MNVITIKEIKQRIDRLLFLLDYELEPDQFAMSYKYFMDSIEFVEFVMTCEREFKLRVPDEDFPSIHTLNDLIQYISKQLNPPLTITPSK